MIRPVYDTMSTLFEHAKDRISVAELESFAGLTEHAVDEARRLSDVCEGIACTVSSDAQGDIRSGSFEGADGVYTLLCALSHSFDTLAAMAHVGNQAAASLHRRRMEGRS